MMKVFLLLLLFFLGSAFCANDSTSTKQKYLHISTIPSGADVFVGNLAPNYGHYPDYNSPQFIPVDGDEILIALFKQDFKDTLLYVNLSKKDTSYLIVSLKPSYDNDYVDLQQKYIAKRGRRALGTKLMLSSIIPFAVGATGAIIYSYKAGQAEDSQKFLKNSHIAQGDKYLQAKDDLKDQRSSAKTAKKTALAGVAIGAALLSIGFILSF